MKAAPGNQLNATVIGKRKRGVGLMVPAEDNGDNSRWKMYHRRDRYKIFEMKFNNSYKIVITLLLCAL